MGNEKEAAKKESHDPVPLLVGSSDKPAVVTSTGGLHGLSQADLEAKQKAGVGSMSIAARSLDSSSSLQQGDTGSSNRLLTATLTSLRHTSKEIIEKQAASRSPSPNARSPRSISPTLPLEHHGADQQNPEGSELEELEAAEDLPPRVSQRVSQLLHQDVADMLNQSLGETDEWPNFDGDTNRNTEEPGAIRLAGSPPSYNPNKSGAILPYLEEEKEEEQDISSSKQRYMDFVLDEEEQTRDASGNDAVPPPLPPQKHQQSEPGAFRAGSNEPTTNANMDSDGENDNQTNPNLFPTQDASQVHDPEAAMERLAEAMPVDEDDQSAIETASKVSQAELSQLSMKALKETSYSRTFVGLGLVAIVAIIIGTFFVGVSVGEKRERANRLSSTTNPSRSPSLAPSLSPSAAPSGVFDSFLENLPNSTIEGLSDPSSYQSKAYAWLSDHRNISFIEEWRKTQLFALACLYFALDGPTWPNGLDQDWLDDSKSECLWFSSADRLAWDLITGEFMGAQGTASCNEKGEFQQLDLRDSLRLKGKKYFFPREVGLLSSLAVIEFRHRGSSSALNGSFSYDILPVVSSLPNLQVLDLWGNSLSGALPPDLGKLTGLKTLRLAGGTLSGQLPSQLGLMTGLESLVLGRSNLISGQLPSQLGLMTSLTRLEIGQTSLSGQIPSELNRLSQVRLIWLKRNQLNGTLPFGGGLASLVNLQLDHNQFSGVIPSQLGLVSTLKILQAHDNGLAGQIPSELSQANLTHMMLWNNALSGTLPSELGILTNMYYFALSENQLTGRIPTEIGMYGGLWNFGLTDNGLTGTIPSELGRMSLVQWIYLSGNELSGTIPTELGLLSSVGSLNLNDNLLSGPIPQYWESLDLNRSSPDPDLHPLDMLAMGQSIFPDFLNSMNILNNPMLSGTVPEQLCLMNTPACFVDNFDWASNSWAKGNCSFQFNCTEILCGCNCSCSRNNSRISP